MVSISTITPKCATLESRILLNVSMLSLNDIVPYSFLLMSTFTRAEIHVTHFMYCSLLEKKNQALYRCFPFLMVTEICFCNV